MPDLDFPSHFCSFGLRPDKLDQMVCRGRCQRAVALAVCVVLSLVFASCKPRNVPEAEAKRDVAWLSENGTTEAVAALGRLADNDPAARTALETRAARDVNVYIAAWTAVTRGSQWGATILRTALADPERADTAASAMARRDPALASFVPDLEGAVSRLAAGKRGSVVAGVLASAGPSAHTAVERLLVDPKTRNAMCDGIGLPDASGDAKSLVLSVKPEARDSPSCVANVVAMAGNEDSVLAWLATKAEPGLVSVVAKSALTCTRLGSIWQRALVERPTADHAALSVPLKLSTNRCGKELDPILADLLGKAPGSRACIIQSLEPFSADLADLPQTCKALKGGWLRGEPARLRERANDAVTHGCLFRR